jgi:hypothetical protein
MSRSGHDQLPGRSAWTQIFSPRWSALSLAARSRWSACSGRTGCSAVEIVPRSKIPFGAFLQAILTELETCWDRAKNTSNPAIGSLPPGKAFETEVFIKTDFFTVYHNNSHYLGQVRDDDLRKQIVATITTYKALVETYNVNTQFFLQWQETKYLEFVTRDKELKRYYGRKAEYEYEKLRGWATALKRDHFQLKQQIETLLPALRRAIETSETA